MSDNSVYDFLAGDNMRKSNEWRDIFTRLVNAQSFFRSFKKKKSRSLHRRSSNPRNP